MSSEDAPDIARFEQQLTENDMTVGAGFLNARLSAVHYWKPSSQLQSGFARFLPGDLARVDSFRHGCAITPPRLRAHAMEQSDQTLSSRNTGW
jgi:hypothetical protein